jgi:hypothetical protein
VAEEFVDADLDLECCVAVLLVDLEVLRANEGDGFVGSFGT